MPCTQCSGITKKGDRCKLRASCVLGCKLFCYRHAYQHTKKVSCKDSKNSVACIGDGVHVKTSTIPGAGLGLFATRNFKKNELITEYDGRIIDNKTAKQVQKNHPGQSFHFVALSLGRTVIDGIKTPIPGRGGASFTNDSMNNPPYNAKFFRTYKVMPDLPDHRTGLTELTRLFLKATRDITKGEEIFVDYNRETRIRMGIE
jgi:hypothetical protein